MKATQSFYIIVFLLISFLIPGKPVSAQDSQPILVDEGGTGFERLGEPYYWKTMPGGIMETALWTYNEADHITNSGRWIPHLPHSGLYEVQVYIPPDTGSRPLSFSKTVTYSILHGDQYSNVKINQQASNGWVSLGTYQFYANDIEFVSLTDETGEPAGSTAVVFDAMQWIPVSGSAANLDAVSVDKIIYDVVLPGEEAKLELIIRNTGLQAWNSEGFLLRGQEKNFAGSPGELSVDKVVQPGEQIQWQIVIPIDSEPGIIRVHYQMMYQGKAFGQRITGYIFVLPKQAANLEDQIRQTVSEWKNEGENALNQLLENILAKIQSEVQQQAQNWIEHIFNQCRGSLGLGAAIFLLGVWRKNRPRIT